MPRVRWSATLEQDDVSSSSLTGIRKSSLKPPSMGPTNNKKSKEVVRKERQRREEKQDGAEAWRERGKLYRAKLIMKDEESGGDAFTLSDECEVEKYYDVAERVLEQFLNTTVEDKAKLTEAYLVGNRLVKFVSRVLPTHSNYFSNDPKLMALRSQSQAQLVQLLQYLEELALIIDEEEYQEFVRENQELQALSGDDEDPSAYDGDSSDEVSSLGDDEPSDSFGEGPSFAASDAVHAGLNESQNLQDFEVPSLLEQKQAQESQSWDRAFSNHIAPKLPELEPRKDEKQQEDPFGNTGKFELEWDFPADFGAPSNSQQSQDQQGKIDTFTSSRSLPVDFANSNTWPSEQDTTPASNGWTSSQDLRQGPDNSSSFSSSPQHSNKSKPVEKMTLRPKALYGSSPSTAEREHSPKSVYELPEFLPEPKSSAGDEDEQSSPMRFSTVGSVDGYFERVDVERPPPSDDGVSMLSGEEEEASLTGAPMPRRRRMGHFKGCVRCLLE